MSGFRSALYSGSVMHHRLRPREHRLRYSIFYMLLDLDEVDMLAGRLHLFSHNRFNLFSFHDRDHGEGETTSPRPGSSGICKRPASKPAARSGFSPCRASWDTPSIR
jgi:DUF1365 family protein